MMKDLLKEVGCYIGCIVFILASAYFAGFFNYNSYSSLSNMVISNIKATGIEKYIDQSTSPRTKHAVYKQYRPAVVPDNVLDGSKSSGAWQQIFNSDKKVIFYVYEKDDNFNTDLNSYYLENKLSKNYVLATYSQDVFNNMRTGTIGPSKICNSLEECNRVREKASNYTLLANFMSNCGRTMCIFKPSQNQYIRLKRREISEAEKLIQGLKNW